MHILTKAAALSIALYATASASNFSFTRPISDQELLTYASATYDKEHVTESHFVLGSNHGESVVVDFICSDVCPAYTVRVIHYQFLEYETCAAIGGVEKALRVPVSIGAMDKTFCFPKIIADNWERYER